MTDAFTTGVPESEESPDSGQQSPAGAAAPKKPRVQRDFPRYSLEEAVRIPQAIKEKNNGNPWPPAEVANAVGSGPRSNNWFYWTTASRDYGLTEGTRDAAEISLTDLGKQVVYPDSAAAHREALVKGMRSIQLFADVLDHFGGSQLPELQYAANTLQTKFKIDPALHEEFIDLYRRNCQYAGIGADEETASSTEKSRRPDSDRRAIDNHVPVCFVAMPFVERDEAHPAGYFDEVYNSILKPAIEQAGFQVKTAHRKGSDVIQTTIIRELDGADLVVADLTEHNPNVLFELGLRMAEEKPVALVRAKGTRPIFDVDNMLRVEEYNPNLWRSTVEKDIPKIADHVLATWENRDSSASYLSILRGQVAPA